MIFVLANIVNGNIENWYHRKTYDGVELTDDLESALIFHIKHSAENCAEFLNPLGFNFVLQNFEDMEQFKIVSDIYAGKKRVDMAIEKLSTEDNELSEHGHKMLNLLKISTNILNLVVKKFTENEK